MLRDVKDISMSCKKSGSHNGTMLYIRDDLAILYSQPTSHAMFCCLLTKVQSNRLGSHYNVNIGRESKNK